METAPAGGGSIIGYYYIKDVVTIVCHMCLSLCSDIAIVENSTDVLAARASSTNVLLLQHC